MPRRKIGFGSGKKVRMQQFIERQMNQKLNKLQHEKLSKSVKANVSSIQETLGTSDDLVVRNFTIGAENVPAAVIFIDGLIDSKLIDEFVLEAVMMDGALPLAGAGFGMGLDRNVHIHLKDKGVPINEVGESDRLQKAIQSILSGDTVLLVEGSSCALLLNTKGWEKRGVEEPRTESVVRGPRNGFTETLRINTAQIRLRLKDPDLRVKNMSVGERSRTDLAIIYIEGVTNPAILEEIMRRIRDINIDAILDSGYIEQLIQDSNWSPFPLIQNTERPDKVAANLLEGKVAIVCDGSPFVLIAPAVFAQFYHSPEDYYERFLISTLIRLIRVLSMGMAILLPSLYIAFSSFHPEMIPSRLVIAMAAGRSTVPFPSIIEAILMEVTMEILREASVRLPGPIGPTIGIVGALVVGQAAVEAGIVSPIMVIIVSLTTIGSFASPSYSAAIALRMLRFPMMFAAAMFGLYGIMLFLILILMHLCSLKSFGVPYMSPISPFHKYDAMDTFFRIPLDKIKYRPISFKPKDRRRAGSSGRGEGEHGAGK